MYPAWKWRITILYVCGGLVSGYLDYSHVAHNQAAYSNGPTAYDTGAPSSDADLAALGNLLYKMASASVLTSNSAYDYGSTHNGVSPAPQTYPVPGYTDTSSNLGASPNQYSTHRSGGRYHKGRRQQMAGSERMLGYSHMSGYGFPQHASGYESQAHQQSYSQAQPHGYGMKYEKPKTKTKKVFVPIVIKKKKKKKRKTIAVYKGFYIDGGTQIFGKFKKIKDCKKACEITPNCFAADYNPWLKKCYIHTNVTACEEMRTHPKLIHFKKVPCDLVETPRGLITLGTQIYGGLEQKGIKSLQDCIKKCATAGSGIAPNHITTEIARQICFGIDYDFGSHKCYFHTEPTLCPELVPTIPTPVQLVAAPSVINILLCPILSITTV